jgi:hypothetical protein
VNPSLRVAVEKGEHLKFDSEGGALVTTPNTRYLPLQFLWRLPVRRWLTMTAMPEFTEQMVKILAKAQRMQRRDLYAVSRPCKPFISYFYSQ